MKVAKAVEQGSVTRPSLDKYQAVDESYPGLQRVSLDPPIYTVTDFLTLEQCESLKSQVSPYLVPATVVDTEKISNSRTSTTCYISREDVPTIINNVCRLLQNKSEKHIELPQVGRYEATQEYQAHYDAFNMDTKEGRLCSENGGQRTCTVLIYLNDVPNGGRTSFPAIDMAFQPKQGMALVFFPATLDGTIDVKALHAALPAIDTKWVCQVWVRQSVYNGVHNLKLEHKI